MADYKVVDAEKLNSDLSAVANSIRAKAETNGDLIFPDGFISAVEGFQKGIIPTGTKNITTNGTHDVTEFASALVNVPTKHFATGVVTNVSSGGAMSVTGIKDAVTGEAFTPTGVACFICTTTKQNYTGGGSTPSIILFYKDFNINDGVGHAAFTPAYTARINPDVPRDYLTVGGNSFTYKAAKGTMYGIMAAERWRWVAWA